MKHFNGRVLKKARTAKRWSIPDLVYQIRHLTGIGMAEGTIRDHEEGRAVNPRAHTIAAYAAALGLEPGAFFGGRR